jgi:hypothetical protein
MSLLQIELSLQTARFSWHTLPCFVALVNGSRWIYSWPVAQLMSPRDSHSDVVTLFALLSIFATFHLGKPSQDQKNLVFLQNVHEKLDKCQIYG